MMDPMKARLYRAQIRQLEEQARRLIREIFAEHDGDVREDERLAFSKADILFAAMEDALFFNPSATDPQRQRIRSLQRRTNEFILHLAELERERRSARWEEEELELEKKALQARQHSEGVAAEAELLDRLRGIEIRGEP